MILALAGCNSERGTTPVEQGRRGYAMNCTACHHPDPALDGTIGPAVAGSSLALIEARLLRAEYPEGYVPKRETNLMTRLPFLASQVEALAAYLSDASSARE